MTLELSVVMFPASREAREQGLTLQRGAELRFGGKRDCVPDLSPGHALCRGCSAFLISDCVKSPNTPFLTELRRVRILVTAILIYNNVFLVLRIV